MTVKEKDQPIYDERVYEILRGLASGKTREDLADEFEHKTWKSIDMYMRRRYFDWDSEQQTYVPKKVEVKEILTDTSRASKVVLLLSKGDVDIRMTAQRLGFKDHHDLASYMNSKGYSWDAEQGNYMKVTDKGNDEPTVSRENILEELHQDVQESPELINTNHYNELKQYLPLLQMLSQHKEELLDLIVPSKDTQKLPRYGVPGVPKTKTVQMMSTLDQLVIDYANEFNISQRNLFEVALIDFFRRYGYKQEIDRYLN